MVAGSDRLDEQRVPLVIPTLITGDTVSHHVLPLTSSEGSLDNREVNHVHQTVVSTPEDFTGSLEFPFQDSSPSKPGMNPVSNHTKYHVNQRSRSFDNMFQWNSKKEELLDSDDPFCLASASDLHCVPTSPVDSQESWGDSTTVDIPRKELDCSDPAHTHTGQNKLSTSHSMKHQSQSASLLYSSTLGCFSDSPISKMSAPSKAVTSRSVSGGTIGGNCEDAVEL